MRKRFHWLKKPKVRADWSKETLYNIARATAPNVASKTFFQQKWNAKALTRAYHGEQIREKQWQRMFRRTLPAVASMDHRYLARSDGSEQATGRGAGEDEPVDVTKRRKNDMTPYMHMTFYPVERRLDTAIWRALFATSARQARQFVVHGWVKVNGKKMIYPGYMLNPGDMFQVDPERVMWATGARKDEKRQVIRVPKKNSNKPASRTAPKEEQISSEETKVDSDAAKTETEAAAAAAEEDLEPNEEDAKKTLTSLIERTNAMMDDTKELSAKRKQDLRGFRQALRKMLSRAKGISTTVTDDLEARLAVISDKLVKTPRQAQVAADELTEEQEELLQQAMEKMRENPFDASKPYLTPWRPRSFMSAFAFIPRYLEVNQNICAAVYLRHPVARPGLAEVPTPFHYETSQLAFNWYLRRR
ncbi:putative 30s ribosomal subunit protein [Neofusicoccum parvum UCRNP2]|uniref:Small ribosomal subunit protein uS4m n=1 Tax=Botryosphaeria parva (strain UCR-NP2) TaxID=1287680 RepID=R1GNG8_BOTPV|nr:putative 30s ribosomal subunit protein [Neofusicoccum parvum UCRNP2]